jgi:hypothetical protein
MEEIRADNLEDLEASWTVMGCLTRLANEGRR